MALLMINDDKWQIIDNINMLLILWSIDIGCYVIQLFKLNFSSLVLVIHTEIVGLKILTFTLMLTTPGSAAINNV